MPVPVPSSSTNDQAQPNSAAAATGQQINQPSTQNVITTSQQKDKEQQEADRLYEERIEEEYAKREGGA
jgi:hypothetical protein